MPASGKGKGRADDEERDANVAVRPSSLASGSTSAAHRGTPSVSADVAHKSYGSHCDVCDNPSAHAQESASACSPASMSASSVDHHNAVGKSDGRDTAISDQDNFSNSAAGVDPSDGDASHSANKSIRFTTGTMTSCQMDDSRNLPPQFLPLLHCAACPPSVLLSSPTTLHCGHTICSKHVRSRCPAPVPSSSSSSTPINSAVPPTPMLPSCPLPICKSSSAWPLSSSPSPNIPASSRVAYFPASPSSAGSTTPSSITHIPDPKLDVAVSKVISLVERAQLWVEEEEQMMGLGMGPDMNRFLSARPGSESDSDQSGSEVDEHEDDGASSQSRLPMRPIPSHPSTRQNSHPPSPPRPSMLRPHPPSHFKGRPSKRQRQHSYTQDSTAPGDENASTTNAVGKFEKELVSELTCEICFMLLYQPVTTPCQHTFCAKCLHRSLDHSSFCPLCRQELPGFVYFQGHPYNKVLLSIILKAFPFIYASRGEAIEAEERNDRLDTPIFVCQLCFPGIPTLLHFFEPRYRLMLRRCLESDSPRFGMIMPPRTAPAQSSNGSNTPTSDYGTMLEIRSVQMLPDGRSMVETWGTYRFRILERGTLDGYMVGRVEKIDDYDDLEENENADPSLSAPGTSSSPTSESHPTIRRIASTLSSSSTRSHSGRPRSPLDSATPANPIPTNVELMTICHSFLSQLRHGMAPWVVQRLNNTYGPMPTDAPNFSFWVALVLPIDEHEKAKLLPIRSPNLRLRLVVHWIEQLNNNWWVYKSILTAGTIILLVSMVGAAFFRSGVYDELFADYLLP